jgi:hypothetical protein
MCKITDKEAPLQGRDEAHTGVDSILLLSSLQYRMQHIPPLLLVMKEENPLIDIHNM